MWLMREIDALLVRSIEWSRQMARTKASHIKTDRFIWQINQRIHRVFCWFFFFQRIVCCSLINAEICYICHKKLMQIETIPRIFSLAFGFYCSTNQIKEKKTKSNYFFYSHQNDWSNPDVFAQLLWMCFGPKPKFYSKPLFHHDFRLHSKLSE